MRYLNGYERTQPISGMGYLGEVRQGIDGNLYQWVQGVDGLGNPIGFWKKLKKWGKRLAKTALKYYPPAAALRSLAPLASRALPYIQRAIASQPVAPAVPVVPVTPVAPVAPMMSAETPAAADAGPAPAGTAGWGLGALLQGPDGTLYQVQGWGEADDLRGVAEDDLRGLGALYQAPDGTLYGVQGWGEADDLRGFAEDELRGLDEPDDLRGFAEDELRGFEEADDLRGFAEDDLRGFEEADELRGFAEDDLRGFEEADDLRGFAEADDLRGFAEDDLRGLEEADDLRGLEAYVSDKPAGTRWFTPPAQTPELWRPLW